MITFRTAGPAMLLVFCCSSSFGVLPAAAHGPIHEQIAALTKRIQQDSQNAALHLKRGELHSYHGEWDAALSDYERAAQLDPALATVDLARGKTLLHAGRYTQAKDALDRFLAGHPEDPEALATRARTQVRLGQPRAAVEDFTRAILQGERVGHLIPDYYLERARALVAQGGTQDEDALRGLDEGIARLGPLVSLQLYAIELELGAKRYEGALARLESVAAQTPRKESWLARRAEILEQAGRQGEARLAYEQAVEAIESLSPRHRKTRATLKLEAQVRAALARLERNPKQEVDP